MTRCLAVGLFVVLTADLHAEDPARQRVYDNRLTPIENPPPLLADYPKFIEAVARVATHVSLSDGERKTQDLRLVDIKR